MGTTTMSPEKVFHLLAVMSNEWPGNSYSLLKRNCCHFCNEMCKELGVGPIPSWVTHLANAGAAIIDRGTAIIDTGLAAEDKIMALDKHVTDEVIQLDQCITRNVTQLDRKFTHGVLEVDRKLADWLVGSVSCGTETMLFGESTRMDGASRVQWIP